MKIDYCPSFYFADLHETGKEVDSWGVFAE